MPVHPLEVLSIYFEYFRRNGRDLPTFPHLFHTFDELPVLDFRDVLGEIFAILEDERIKVDK